MTQETNSINVRKSRYVSGGVTEVGEVGLEWWDRSTFANDASDTEYVVEAKFAGRIDQLSAIFLGDSRYWWLLAMYNNILDPIAEIVTGAVIYIPSPTRVQSILSGKAGGVPSTREIPTTVLPIV